MTRYSATCHLNFFPNPNETDDVFERVIVSEDSVARRQIEEDLQLYGSRPEPPDTVDVDESTQLANLPPKRNASEFKAVVDHLALKNEKDQSKEFNYETLTVMDWNSGASPLDAWLNQSAIPSTTPASNHQEILTSESDLLAQEAEELKVFRNVHMAIAPDPENNDPPHEPVEGLDFGAQIYYRNIMDRFPVLPKYLARRLAQANCVRAERLRHERERLQKKQEWLQKELEKLQKEHAVSATTPPPLVENWTPPPPVDFWTRGSQSLRAASVHSRSSSMNSSLHGRPVFDPEEQDLAFASKLPALKTGNTGPSRALPPAPVELDRVTLFNCGICGKKKEAKRRLGWQ